MHENTLSKIPDLVSPKSLKNRLENLASAKPSAQAVALVALMLPESIKRKVILSD